MKRNILTIIIILIDQISKILVTNYLPLNKSIKIINNFFYLTYTKNDGAAWSILSGETHLLIIITILSIYLIIKYTKEYNNLFLCLLYGGIIGNLIDRLIHGYVIDFLDFKIFNYDYPIFNISDICIFIGITLLIIKIVKEENNGSIKRRYKHKNR